MGESIESGDAGGHELAADGERFLPGRMTGEIELEHVHRYKFAAPVCARKVVLDIASGEGYGSAYLSGFARRVIGVDISRDAVECAKLKYKSPNLEFRVGSCSKIPLEDASVDVVVSFETIEHHAEHEAMMREIKRVLRPRGVLVISSPDKREYSDKPGFSNPFHVKELYREEFDALLRAHFKHVRLFGQKVLAGSVLFSEGESQELEFHETAFESAARAQLPAAKYLVAIASDRSIPAIKGGILECEPPKPQPDKSEQEVARLVAQRMGPILRAISIPDSACLKNRLNGPWYLARNQDVVEKGHDPYAHWISFGAAEGRLPAENIDDLARELVAEHEEKWRALALERERGAQKLQEEMLERQRAFERQIEQIRSAAREEVEAQLRLQADRERALAAELLQHEKLAAEVRDAERIAADQQLRALSTQYREREQNLHAQLAAREQQLHRRQQEAHEELEAQLRLQAERERAMAGELLLQQKQAAEEREVERKAGREQLQTLSAQHQEREQVLQAKIAEREREYKDLQRESVEQRRELESLIGQNRIAATYASEAQREAASEQLRQVTAQHQEREQALRAQVAEHQRELRQRQEEALAHQRALEEQLEEIRSKAHEEVDSVLRLQSERERAMAGELLQQQKIAAEARDAERSAANEQLLALSAQQQEREAALHARIAEREREFENLRRESVEQRRELESLIGQNRIAANYASEVQREAANAQLQALSARHQDREQSLLARIAEREREFSELQRDLLEKHRTLESSIDQGRIESGRQLQAMSVQHQERERSLSAQHQDRERVLSAQLAERERDLRQRQEEAQGRQQSLERQIEQVRTAAREQIEAQLRALVDRERAFAADFSRVEEFVNQERQLLRDQYFSIVNFIRSTLDEMRSRGSWLTWGRTPARLGSLWSSTPVPSSSMLDWIAMRELGSERGPGDNAYLLPLNSDGMPVDRGDAWPEHGPQPEESPDKKVATVAELLAYDGREFVTRAYETLLGRKPDADGYPFYLDQLRATGDKAAIIYQIGTSREARQYSIELDGLAALIWSQRWKRMPILGRFVQKPEQDRLAMHLRPVLDEIERRIAMLDQSISSRVAGYYRNSPPGLEAQIKALFRSFDPREYLASNPDVTAAGMNPYEHFLRYGWQEKRRFSSSFPDPGAETAEISVPEAIAADEPGRMDATPETTSPPGENAAQDGGHGPAEKNKWTRVLHLESGMESADGQGLTRFMEFILKGRPDVQKAFDISVQSGRMGFFNWLLVNGTREMRLTASVFPPALLERLRGAGGEIGAIAERFLGEQRSAKAEAPAKAQLAVDKPGEFGANLVGYAYAELGMGEAFRMMAQALNHARVPLCIIDQDAGLHGTGDLSVAGWVTDEPRFDMSIIAINADLFPFLPFKLGESFAAGRYIIGYWAWELSNWPEEFDLALDMVDEVWAMSDYVANSIKTRARVPVYTMPNAVAAPELAVRFDKAHYGIPPGSFAFYFIFDAASYLDRKNPVAVVRAFKRAFPGSEPPVHLLLKTMNIDVAGPLWTELLQEIAGDPRITVLSHRMSKEEVLGLNVACDAFVSLHRSEGFGRCVAEAMAYGRPVIVTNYSGTRDFATEKTACVVNYRLIPVPDGAYPFCHNQFWAEPDIEHAASLMQRVAGDPKYRSEISSAGQRFVRDNFSLEAIGARVAKRLREVQARQIKSPAAGETAAGAHDATGAAIIGNIDLPTAEQCLQAVDMLPIVGWAASERGIDRVRVHVGTTYVADARYGTLRDDILQAFPQMPDAARSGFSYELRIADLPDGQHEFSVVAESPGGISRTWSGVFEKSTKSDRGDGQKDGARPEAAPETREAARVENSRLTLVLKAGAAPDAAPLARTLKSLATQRASDFELLCVLSDGAHEEEIRAIAAAAGLTATLQFIVTDIGNWKLINDHVHGAPVRLIESGDIFPPAAFAGRGHASRAVSGKEPGAGEVAGSAAAILGNIDVPTAEQCLQADDVLPIEGWAASLRGISKVRIYVGTKFISEAHYGALRGDILEAFPQMPEAARSGFCYMLDIADLPDGQHSFSVVAEGPAGVSRTWTMAFDKKARNNYQDWQRLRERLYVAHESPRKPRSVNSRLTLVLRVGAAIDGGLFAQTMKSLAEQRVSNFDLLCVLTDVAQEAKIREISADARLKAKLRFIVADIGNWKLISEHVRGALIGLVDGGDVFEPWAFEELDQAVQQSDKRIDLIYADEDTRDGDQRVNPVFKPGWSPIFLENHNYIGRPWFAARTVFSSAVNALPHDVALFSEHELLKRIGAKSSVIGHLPAVLLSRCKSAAGARSRVALREKGPQFRDGYVWPRASIIIPTRLSDEALVAKCFDGLASHTDYPNFEVIIVVNNVADPGAVDRLLAPRPFKVVAWNGGFNWSAINNLGVAHADGELFLFMNDDVEPLDANWLKALVDGLVRSGAGVAGCMLKYPNGTIQHGGVHFVNYGGGARHLFRFCRSNKAGLEWLMANPREVSAVTGACLLTSRECFTAVSGFDEGLPLVGNDTDYCLRVWQSGFSVIMQPDAQLIHHEGISRAGMSDVVDVEVFWKKWGAFLERGDLFTNPNLDLTRDDWVVGADIETVYKVRLKAVADGNGHSGGVLECAERLSKP